MLQAALIGVGTLLQYNAQKAASRSEAMASRLNAEEAERNAVLAKQRAEEDQRVFRASFRRDQAYNIASVGASGVKLEGSPLEVLRDNVTKMEEDALNITRRGQIEKESYLRQAGAYRLGAKFASQAGNLRAGASLLSGAVDTISAVNRSGGRRSTDYSGGTPRTVNT